jgi:hypothetical protein
MSYNLLNDIDETLRQERLATMWKEWRAPLLVGVVVALVTLVGVELWKSHTNSLRAEAANAYWQASQSGADAADKFAAVAQSKDATYRSLARLQLASLNAAEASNYFEAVMNDRSAPGELRDLATLQLGQRLLATDEKRAEEVLTDLADGKGAFALLAHEMLGTLAENQGNTEKAKTHYAIILQQGDVGTDLLHRARLRNEVLSQ